jgi:hypothetical protein
MNCPPLTVHRPLPTAHYGLPCISLFAHNNFERNVGKIRIAARLASSYPLTRYGCVLEWKETIKTSERKFPVNLGL